MTDYAIEEAERRYGITTGAAYLRRGFVEGVVWRNEQRVTVTLSEIAEALDGVTYESSKIDPENFADAHRVANLLQAKGITVETDS